MSLTFIVLNIMSHTTFKAKGLQGKYGGVRTCGRLLSGLPTLHQSPFNFYTRAFTLTFMAVRHTEHLTL